MHNRDASAAGLLTFFAGRFDMKTATGDDLAYLSGANESAIHKALSLSEHVCGIADLLSSLRDHCPALPARGIEQDGQAALLWGIARDIELIGRMVEISSEADYELHQRAQQPTPKRKTPNATTARASA